MVNSSWSELDIVHGSTRVDLLYFGYCSYLKSLVVSIHCTSRYRYYVLVDTEQITGYRCHVLVDAERIKGHIAGYTGQT